MPRGDKSNHTDKQERKADHIAKGHGKRDVSENEAELRAWATASKESGGASKSGAERREMDTHMSAKSAGEIGGKASASRPAAERSASAKKATATRKHSAEHHAHH